MPAQRDELEASRSVRKGENEFKREEVLSQQERSFDRGLFIKTFSVLSLINKVFHANN